MTILHMEDWFDKKTNKQRAIVHKQTKNKTFIRMALTLSKMGIVNRHFFLSLYDPILADVDPHKLDSTTDPTGDLRERVAREANRNIWYF